MLVHMSQLKKNKHRCSNTCQGRKNSRPLDQSHHVRPSPLKLDNKPYIKTSHLHVLESQKAQSFCCIRSTRFSHCISCRLTCRRSPVQVRYGPPTSTFSLFLLLFTELTFENCVNNCFKWFSKVLLKLKPRLCVFSTNSLSR